MFSGVAGVIVGDAFATRTFNVRSSGRAFGEFQSRSFSLSSFPFSSFSLSFLFRWRVVATTGPSRLTMPCAPCTIPAMSFSCPLPPSHRVEIYIATQPKLEMHGLGRLFRLLMAAPKQAPAKGSRAATAAAILFTATMWSQQPADAGRKEADLKIVDKPIKFDQERIQLTIAYRQIHQDKKIADVIIHPQIIILHWTGINSFQVHMELL